MNIVELQHCSIVVLKKSLLQKKQKIKAVTPMPKINL